MPDPMTRPLDRPRHRLRTFGTLALVGPDDAIAPGRGSQRRLALLAVLAAAGERGRSRDELFLLFWPDVTQARARHSLEQLLYSVRMSLDKQLFVGVNPVRINPELLGSDVGDFNDAVSRGDHASAVEHYQGAFLEGFYLSDAPEFEQWTATERAQLQRKYTESLSHQAEAAEAASDHTSAVRWWGALADTDPLSSRYAAGLVRALMAAGDNASALRHAEQHEAAVSQALGTRVGPAVAQLVATLRESSPAPAVEVRPRAVPTVPGPRQRTRNRALPYVLVASTVAALTLGAMAWLRPNDQPSAASAKLERSVAVLPFSNLSRRPEDAPIVDGITEALIAVLSRVENLRVPARTSAFVFANTNLGVRAIADSLGVSHVLEGSVQREAGRVRVQVRLVEAMTGATLWSDTYDRDAMDIFAVQSDIANRVARQLELRIGDGPLIRRKRGSTSSVAAYELYLRGNDQAMVRSDSTAGVALEYFRQAIAIDTGYAGAHAGFARMQLRVRTGARQTPANRSARLDTAEAAARTAIALDDSLAEAHAALSLVYRNRYKLALAEAAMKRAVDLEPANARFREWLVQLYIFTERPAEALVEAQHALRLDPLSATASAELANALLANDRCDEALARLEVVKLLRPPLLRAASVSAQCYARKQMWPEAIREAQRYSTTAAVRSQALLGNLLARSGRQTEARTVLQALLERASRADAAFEVAVVYAGLGDNDQAFVWLDRAVDDGSLAFDQMQSVLQDLRRDPRFDRIRARLGYQKR